MTTRDDAAGLFDDLPAVDGTTMARLRERLVTAAQRDGLLDVAYRTVDTPLGELLLAASERGLLRVAFAREGHDDVLATLADTVSPRILRAPVRLERVSRQLDEYFTGRRTAFDVGLDLRLVGDFRRTVLGTLPSIGYGQTRTYAQVAAAAGKPTAVRAVGTACARNPVPVVVPCHRVVRSDGALGGYRGGPEAKQALLRMEQAA